MYSTPKTPTPSSSSSSTITSVMPYDVLYNGTRVRFRIEHLRDYHEDENGFNFHHHHLNHHHKPVPHLCYSALLLNEEYYLPPAISHFPVSSITGVSIYPPSVVRPLRSYFLSFTFGRCCRNKHKQGNENSSRKFTEIFNTRSRRLVLKFSRGTTMELIIESRKRGTSDTCLKEQEAAVVQWFTEHLIAGREHRRVDWPYRFFLNRGWTSSYHQIINHNQGCLGRCWQSMWTLSADSGLFARKYVCGDFLDYLESVEQSKVGAWLDFASPNKKKKVEMEAAAPTPAKLVYTHQEYERCA